MAAIPAPDASAAQATKSSRTALKAQPKTMAIPLKATQLSAVRNNAFRTFTALCEFDGQMYGAERGKIHLIGDDGKITRTITVKGIRNPTIARHTAGTMVIGDRGTKLIYQLNVKTGKLTKFFSIRDIRPGRFVTGSILKSSPLMSIASDGRYIYAAFSAGFSSSIFKIDPARKSIVGHAWAPGDNPTSMVFQDENLFVLESKGKQIRRFNSALKPSYTWINVTVGGGKGLIIRGDEVRILSTSDRSIIRLKTDVHRLIAAPISALILQHRIVRTDIKVLEIPHKYAVLICGDIAESCYYCDAFWNDTLWLYKTLRNAGYTKENIYVLYGNGNDFASANPRYQYPEAVTDFPATITWTNKVFDGLKNGDAANGIKKMKSIDTLFLWTFDHGAGGNPAYLCLMDGNMSDTYFANKANAISYEKRAIFMQQCRSGGFIDNMKNSKTFISTACRATENAGAADTENENYGGTKYWHGEYNYHIISALSKLTPGGSAINADTSGNGKVSAREAHNWDVSHESLSEIPQMDDTGGVGNNFHIQ